MGLYQKYRPQTLKALAGNETLKKDLEPYITGKKEPPHAMLFTGPSGTGKSTCSRIFARGIGCSDMDITELDTADFRGIDSIRDIRRQIGLASLNGKNRAWILDECFAAGTPVLTKSGNMPIERVKAGQNAYSAAGMDTVVRTYKNRVELDRVCRLELENGTRIYCSREHLFFVAGLGWVEAWKTKSYTLLHSKFFGGGMLPIPQCSVFVNSVVHFDRDNYRPDDWPCIGRDELEQGFVYFYDLEMERDHSYFANNVLVHNCHKLTNEAQNALLKALEEPPSHVFFILCTTDPQMLLKTILTRCTQFALEPLGTKELVTLMARICRKEEADVPEDVLRELAKKAQGSARAALSMLERVLVRGADDYALEVESYVALETQIRELCQALIKGKSRWADIASQIKGIKEEPESVRRAVLGYMNAILLNGKDSPRAAYIMDCFKEPYYNTGPAGLTLSCYAAMLKE